MSDDQLRQQRQQDAIQRKEKVQEGVSNLREGNIPSNDTLVKGIDNLRTSEAVSNTTNNMSPAGQQVMENVQKTMQTTKKVVEEKNSDQELQTVIQQGFHSGKGAAELGKQNVTDEHIREGNATAQELAQEGSRRAWNVARLMVSSREFRRLVADLEGVFSDAIRAGISGDPQQKEQIGSNIGNNTEADPQEALQRTGNTARAQAGDVYRAGVETTQPTVDKFASGEATFGQASKEIGSNVAGGIKESVKGIKITGEQRDQLLNRIKNILLDAHSSQEYQTAIDDLMSITSQIGDQGESFGQQLKQTHEATQQEHGEKIDDVTQSSKRLVEKFANNNSLDPLINSVREFGSHIKNDNEMRDYLKQVREFVHKSIRDTDYIQSEQYNQKASELFDKGQYEFKERYRDDTNHVLDQAQTFGRGFKDDPLNQELASDLQNLTKSLFLDEEGKPTFKYELFKDFASMVPVIAAQIEYLPLPPIDKSDEEYDIHIDNLVLRCSNVVPRHVKISTETQLDMEPPSEHGDRVQGASKGSADISNLVTIQLSHVRADARDVQFDFRKKKTIKVHDSGLIDMHIPDRGLDITMVVRNSGANTSANVMEVVKVQCKLHEIKLKMRDTKHDMLYKILSPVINTVVKKQAEKNIAEQLKKVLIRMDQRVGVLQEKAQVKAQEKKEQAQVKAQQAKDQAQEQAQNANETLQNKAKDTHESVRDNLQETRDNVQSQIQSNADSGNTNRDTVK
ncbi:hypothetical protein INT43_006986 [Umbelopsis isabellina]|uniref:Uncharacterized protein n=1 Tax=Mortierella isabellina TaxID=91625 RepID=A0A8H7UGD5_MORIS|nr:hypothetical protein INT43_006986 [Umbelopsis isabellina]